MTSLTLINTQVQRCTPWPYNHRFKEIEICQNLHTTKWIEYESSDLGQVPLKKNERGDCNHSDSLDTLLYARFYHSEPRVLWMETKNLGWAPSRDPTTTILAPWLSATPSSMYEKKKNVEKPFPPWVRAVSKIYNSIGEFTIPLEVCILMRGVQWALWFVTSSWSECGAISVVQPSSLPGERRSVG